MWKIGEEEEVVEGVLRMVCISDRFNEWRYGGEMCVKEREKGRKKRK